MQLGAKTASRYTPIRLRKSCSFRLETGYMVLSEKVMAFKKVFIELFIKSTKGSFTGYFSEPHSTLCSRMWNTPVSSSGRVLKATEKSLFISPLSIQHSCAPVLSWVISYSVPESSSAFRARVTVKPYSFCPTDSSIKTSLVFFFLFIL